MRNDKEFKSKNRDESYVKDKSPDIQLGRHTEGEKQKPPITPSKKNRMYRARQTENTAANSENTPAETKIDISVSKTADNNVPVPADSTAQIPDRDIEPTETENISQDIQPDIPKAEPSYSSAAKKKKYRSKMYRVQKQTKSVDYNFAEQAQKSDDYDISEKAQENKTEFSKNTDMDFSENKSERDSNIPFDSVRDTKSETDKKPNSKKRQKLSFDKSAKTENAESDTKTTCEKTDASKSDSSDIPFDRVNRRARKFEKKAEKAKSKAEKAEQNLPHKRKIKRKRLYDEQKQKPKNRLQFEKEVKPQSDLYHRSPVKTGREALQHTVLNKLHSKVAEVENENTGVEAAHQTEQKAESLARYSVRTAKYIDGQRKAVPYKKAARLKVKAEKAEIKAAYEKTLAENPSLKKTALKKFRQKQQIKKKYQKAKRAEQTAKQAKKAAQNAERAASRLAAFIWRHKAVFGAILAIVLLIAWLGTALSSCSVIGTTGFNSIMVSSYFAEDEDIYAAENYYNGLEQNLQSKIDNIENEYSGYDEYNYNLAGIGHNPYELISYLTAVYQDFKFNDIKSALDTLFNAQYHLQITETSRQQTDEDGNEYTYKILNVTLVNEGMTTTLTADQRELYDIYLVSKGNRDYLFADDIYSNITQSPYNDYTIPGEALTDETFRKLITEAEKYLGYPYVWGGSSPQTSFDCSGFVCWVFKNSGVYPLGRTTAQGIFDLCTPVRPSDAKPGDIIFFTGTYNSGCPVSHVGIYVGNGMMIHCGNPIQYASVNSNYWTQHFYAYGRLN